MPVVASPYVERFYITPMAKLLQNPFLSFSYQPVEDFLPEQFSEVPTNFVTHRYWAPILEDNFDAHRFCARVPTDEPCRTIYTIRQAEEFESYPTKLHTTEAIIPEAVTAFMSTYDIGRPSDTHFHPMQLREFISEIPHRNRFEKWASQFVEMKPKGEIWPHRRPKIVEPVAVVIPRAPYRPWVR